MSLNGNRLTRHILILQVILCSSLRVCIIYFLVLHTWKQLFDFKICTKEELFTSRLIWHGNTSPPFIFILVYVNSVEFCQTSCALYFMFRTLLFYVFIIVGQLTFLHESPAQCYLHLPFPPPSPFFNRRSFWSPRSGTPAMQASSSCFDSMTSLGSGMRCWIPPQTLSTLGSCGFQGEKEITRICHRSRCAVTNWVDS